MTDIDEAIAALRAGTYNRADEVLTALGGGKPGNAARLRLLWAIAQILCRKFRDGVEAIVDVADRGSNRLDPIYRKVLLAIGPLDALLPAAAAQEVRLRIGDYFLRQNKPDEAMSWLAAARTAASDDPLAIYLEANCRFALYGERQAVADMEAILDRAAAEVARAYFIGGGTAALWYRLGLVHERLKNLDQAARYLTTAVRLDTRNDSQRILLGDVLIRLGRFDEALAQLGLIDRSSEGYRFAARLRAVALFSLGDPEAALELLEEVADLDPLGALTFLEMARIYLALGDNERAEVALARAFRTSPELPGLKSAIISLEHQLGRHMDPDAGLPPPDTFAIPEEFAPRPDDPALFEVPSLRRGIASHLRILRTLIVRDILSKYGHQGMGYLWAFMQPLVWILTLYLVYSIAGRRAPLGTSTFAYLAAGILPFICFYTRVQAAVSGAVVGNVSLLYFREVTPLALIVASAVREYLTSMVFYVIICAGIALYDKSVQIPDPLAIFTAVTLMALLATSVGTVLGLARLAMPSLELAELVIYRFMFFFSGALYYGNLLPPRLREWALLNPLFHLIEFVRTGFFASYHAAYANWHYPLEWVAVGLALTMTFVHAMRRYAVAQ